MDELVDDLIKLNQSGQILELCEKYYDERVLMLNNGTIFAESMQEAYDKQKGFVDSVAEFEINLISKKIEGNVSELIFHYKMTANDAKVTEFTGKHTQYWNHQKIVKEEYESIS